ncbi:hypothetical protein TUBRATIS_26750 [Tubulinosema ratisbonensis]|uniref:Uncharacterized protein n=1 Tax=Tubulinosema ratisbonensis TaxID=291195 RepID=A0A437AIC8_9MICR|nr:hypothetical protein TUBRATIS_26750 [Tubulinosema ratisbonensis]
MSQSYEEEIITLELNKDYLVTKPKLDFYKHILSTYKNISIITLFKEKVTQLKNMVDSFDKQETIVTTPNNFVNLNIKNHFVIIEDPNLVIPFEYSECIQKIKKDNSLIALSDKVIKFDYLNQPIIISSTRKCFIKCNLEEKFVILFCVIKFNIIKDDLSVVVTSEFMKEKIKIFLKVFGYEGFNRVFMPEECEGGRILVFSDDLLQIEGVDLIYLSQNDIQGVKESKFDFKKGENYLYKIRNVLQAITPNVCKKRKEFQFHRFDSLKNILK